MKTLKSFWEHVQATLFYSVAFDPGTCNSCWLCYDVCPVGCFRPVQNNHQIKLCYPELCIACGACGLQCPSGAAQLRLREN